MKIGISSYSFTWAVGVKGYMPQNPINEIDLLNIAKELNVSVLQIADNLPLHQMGEDRINHLIQTANKMNISLEAGANRMTAENLDNYIHIASKIKSPILRFVIDGQDYKPSIDECIGIIKNSIPALTKNNIILAIENHDRILSSDFVKIIKTINSNYVQLCLDCANSLGSGEGLKEVVLNLAPHTVNFHLKEVSIKRKYHMMGFDIEGKPFGEGILPLKWMIEQIPLKCKTAILEQWTPPENKIEDTIKKEKEWATKSILYLKQYFD